MDRFAGTVEYLGDADVQPIVDWITAIDFEDWPQQTRLEDGKIRPAMVKDPEWHGFGAMVADHIADASARHIAGHVTNVMLTVVMPGHDIPPHVDQQPPNWITRVHAPLTTNDESQFMVGGADHHMEVGKVYLVNTTVEHAVRNDGATPRIHLMYDVMA